MRSQWTVKQPLGFLFKFIFSVTIVLVVPVALAVVWLNGQLQAPSESAENKIFVIKPDESPASFSKRLQEEGVVKNAFVFRIYLRYSGYDKKVQAGSFRLPKNMKAQDLAAALTKGRLDIWLTLVEGLRKEQVAEKIVEAGFEINEKEFLRLAKEGYLFPDTYLIPVSADEEKILQILTANFNKKITQRDFDKAAKNGLTKTEVIILASLIERETRNDSERPVIAGILLNRLVDGTTLGVDATIQYALGYSKEEENWWRKNLTFRDLQIDSPFNTRRRAGLPPRPICSPGFASLQAAVSPKQTSYYYYLHDSDGNIHYARTNEEHEQNKAKYLD